jgi:hypothetical protein
MRRSAPALTLVFALFVAPFVVGTIAPRVLAEGPYRYAWVPVDAFDRAGKPIVDEKGEPIRDGFCILWKTNWLTENSHLPITEGVVWWTGVSYTVDLRNKLVTVDRVWGPDALATSKGPKFFSRNEIEYGVRQAAPLLDTPRDDWPCTKDTWATILAGAKEWTTQSIMPRSTYWITRSCSPNCQ